MKPGGGHAKGSKFERKICKQLSLWWTYGKRDDVFWRTQTSGARATQRAKKGKATPGQVGDITATETIASRLTTMFTFELKTGYRNVDFTSLIDSDTGGMMSKWLVKLCEHCRRSGGIGVLIFRRLGKDVLVCFEDRLYSKLAGMKKRPMHKRLIVRLASCGRGNWVVMKLSDFLQWLKPEDI